EERQQVSGKQIITRSRSGTQKFFDMSVAIKDGSASKEFVVLLRNKTELRLAEERERVRHAVAEKLTQGTPLADVMEFIASHVTKAEPELLIAIFLKQRACALRV